MADANLEDSLILRLDSLYVSLVLHSPCSVNLVFVNMKVMKSLVKILIDSGATQSLLQRKKELAEYFLLAHAFT